MGSGSIYRLRRFVSESHQRSISIRLRHGYGVTSPDFDADADADTDTDLGWFLNDSMPAGCAFRAHLCGEDVGFVHEIREDGGVYEYVYENEGGDRCLQNVLDTDEYMP